MSSGNQDSEWNQNVSESLRRLQAAGESAPDSTTPAAASAPGKARSRYGWQTPLAAALGAALIAFALYPYLRPAPLSRPSDQPVRNAPGAGETAEIGTRISTVETSLEAQAQEIQALKESIDRIQRQQISVPSEPALAAQAASVAPAQEPQEAPQGDQANLEAVAARLEEFIRVWSDGNAQAYIDFFEPRYVPDTRVSHEQWVATRRQLVRPERGIRVTVSDLKVMPQTDGSIQTQFRQDFSSPTYADVVDKVIVWRDVDGQWRIVSEASTRR